MHARPQKHPAHPAFAQLAARPRRSTSSNSCPRRRTTTPAATGARFCRKRCACRLRAPRPAAPCRALPAGSRGAASHRAWPGDHRTGPRVCRARRGDLRLPPGRCAGACQLAPSTLHASRWRLSAPAQRRPQHRSRFEQEGKEEEAKPSSIFSKPEAKDDAVDDADAAKVEEGTSPLKQPKPEEPGVDADVEAPGEGCLAWPASTVGARVCEGGGGRRTEWRWGSLTRAVFRQRSSQRSTSSGFPCRSRSASRARSSMKSAARCARARARAHTHTYTHTRARAPHITHHNSHIIHGARAQAETCVHGPRAEMHH